jgi:hypothetical protein
MIVNIGKSGIDFNDFLKNLYKYWTKAELRSSIARKYGPADPARAEPRADW